MGTTSDKLTYLATTKTKIKDAINLGNTNITNETFRQYENKIKQAMINTMNDKWGVWNNFDKVIGTNETLTLNNTEYAPMQVNLKGNTSQASDPTPDSPVDINVVSGDNTIEICGKNLFDVNAFENQLVTGKIINNNGVEVSDGTSTYSKYKIFLKANTAYHLKGAWQSIYYYDENDNFKSKSPGFNGADRTYTPTKNEYIRLQISNSYWASNKGQEQIELGNTASTFEPYTGNSQLISLGVENLWEATISSSSATRLQSSIFKVEPNTVYTFNGDGSNLQAINYYKDINKNDISNFGFKDLPFTYTTPNNCYYIQMLIRKSDNSNITTSDITNIQLTKGDHIQYISNTPIELCKIGTYQDFIREGTGKNLFNGNSITPFNANCDVTFNNEILTYTNNNNYDVTITLATITLSESTKIYASINTASTKEIAIYNGNSYVNSLLSTSQTSNNVTLSAGAYTIKTSSPTEGVLTLKELMISTSSDTLYEPYGFKDKWYLHKEIGKYTFTGTEGWVRATRSDNTTHFYQTTLSSINLGNTTLANELSNNFKLANPYTDNGNSFWLYKSGANEIARIGFSDETIDTADKLKTWLTNNQTITYYILATPTNTEITDSTLISQLEKIWYSYKGQTNISQENNDKPFIITATALEDISNL